VQNLSSSSLLAKNMKIQIYRSIILPVVLYGYEAMSLASWEECRLRVLENRVLKILGRTERETCQRKKHKVG
jgi:hypothetical protein